MFSSACGRGPGSLLSHELRFVRFALAVAAVTMSSWSASTPNPPEYCQQKFLGSETGVDAYVFRGDRCEGVYRLKLSGSGRIALCSLTSSRSEAGLAEQGNLQVSWEPLPTGVQLRISVVPLDSPILYRMDTEVKGSKGVFQWPAKIARELFSGYRNLGVVAYYLANGQAVHVPCALGRLTGRPLGRLRADISSPDPIRTLELFYRPCCISRDCDSLAGGSLAFSVPGRDRDGTFTAMIDWASWPRSHYYNLRFAGQIANAPPVATSVVVRIPSSGVPPGLPK
jgi:hypothetical protein